MLETEKGELKINDGNGLFDAAGFCDNLLRILNDVEVKGVRNCQHLYMVAGGIELLRDTLKDKRKEGSDEHDSSSERADV